MNRNKQKLTATKRFPPSALPVPGEIHRIGIAAT
jgi:hypothetical protein